MKRLLSIVNDGYTLERLGNNEKELRELLRLTGCDGFEVLKTEEFREGIFPDGTLIGRHLWFYPMWMDLIRGDEERLLKDFGTLEKAHEYYRATDRKGFIENLKQEFLDTEAMRAEYAVMHVSHMNLEEAYTYRYHYSTPEIVEEFVSLINEAMESHDFTFTLLLENNWYPGLDLTSYVDALRLLDGIEYERTGFLLDTGHLVNTDRSIRNTEEAIRLIKKRLEGLKELKGRILGIHLNLTFSGEYALKTQESHTYDETRDYGDRMNDAMVHVGKIDNHEIFNDNGIGEILKELNPHWLVYELRFSGREDLIRKIELQNTYLDLSTF